MQTPLVLYDDLANTQTVTDEGLNILRQDVPDTSLEPSKTPLLIADLSS